MPGPADQNLSRATVEPIAAGETQPAQPRTLSAEQIFDGEREVVIAHAGEFYRLRITRRNKLILQK